MLSLLCKDLCVFIVALRGKSETVFTSSLCCKFLCDIVTLWSEVCFLVLFECATSALRGNGTALDDTLLQYLSPLGWEHINLTGDYLWRSSAKVGAGKFRPLRPLPPA